jgi:hypothetical protein
MEVKCVVLCKLRRGGGGAGKSARAAGRGGGAAAEEREGAALFWPRGSVTRIYDRRALALFCDGQLEGVREGIGDGRGTPGAL